VVFTVSGSLRLVILASCFRLRMRDMIVGSDIPLFCMLIAKFTRSCIVSLFIGAGSVVFGMGLGEPARVAQDGRPDVQGHNERRDP